MPLVFMTIIIGALIWYAFLLGLITVICDFIFIVSVFYCAFVLYLHLEDDSYYYNDYFPNYRDFEKMLKDKLNKFKI